MRYTLDGSEPSSSSSLYTGAINISSSATLTAKAFKEGLDDSETVTHECDLSFQLKLSKTFGGSDYDCLLNTIQTSDGGYIAVGSTRSNDGDILDKHDQWDGWIIKINSIGEKVWSKCFGGSDEDRFKSIIKTNDNGYMAVGNTKSNDGDVSGYHSNRDGWILKLE
ncbi:MAG TPA: chitobiase/beta-hexosaminidase C-terminal domain-containing protein [Petrotogaceae bacterium]|nr:chitobiase/beta-hexosaminidase C-terminal domain-containing protein [Petrotogaceae bacterium]HQF32582.1 chitobiase/beta-hexosaminidase C-terminal domain-containing protein [Petrotogaceae bacterium]HQH32456.1 chitobiase/beta-hexosaminidase C-terminal domain-containing protein [Petrotogaceae bacterium]